MNTKTARSKKTKKSSKSNSKVVSVVNAKHPVLRHFRLIDNKHTGKLMHFRHTSHLALMGMLIFVGLLLYMSVMAAYAVDGSVTVGVTVNGPAPTIGAAIISPLNESKIADKTTAEVSGTCQPNTFVVVQNDSITVGSAVCTDAGIFILQVQLHAGDNILSALNYDNLNQSGPTTPLVKVTVITSKPVTPINPVLEPAIPSNPSVIPGVGQGVSDCDGYKFGDLPVTGDPRVVVICIPRLFSAKTQQTLDILVWGGTPPYAISIDWSNGANATLLSLKTPGYYKENFSYLNSGVYKIDIRLTDNKGMTTIVQTSVQVNGEIKTPISIIKDDLTSMSWFKTPVPLYMAAVGITLGFWGGDIFDRRFGATSQRRNTRKPA